MNGALADAALLAAAGGLRSSAAPFFLSRAASRKRLSMPGSLPLRLLGSPGAATLLSVALAGELVADKLPSVPARTSPPALTGRMLSGALAGGSSSGRSDTVHGRGHSSERRWPRPPPTPATTCAASPPEADSRTSRWPSRRTRSRSPAARRFCCGVRPRSDPGCAGRRRGTRRRRSTRAPATGRGCRGRAGLRRSLPLWGGSRSTARRTPPRRNRRER